MLLVVLVLSVGSTHGFHTGYPRAYDTVSSTYPFIHGSFSPFGLARSDLPITSLDTVGRGYYLHPYTGFHQVNPGPLENQYEGTPVYSNQFTVPVDPNQFYASVDPNQFVVPVEQNQFTVPVNSNRFATPVDPNKYVARLDPDQITAAVDQNQFAPTIDQNQSSATLDPYQFAAPVDPSQFTASLNPSQFTASLIPSQFTASLIPSQFTASLNPSQFAPQVDTPLSVKTYNFPSLEAVPSDHGLLHSISPALDLGTSVNIVGHPASAVGPVDLSQAAHGIKIQGSATIHTNVALPPQVKEAGTESFQFHAQDEFGNTEYGYRNQNSAKHEVASASGVVRGSYSYVDEAGEHTVNYLADDEGFRLI